MFDGMRAFYGYPDRTDKDPVPNYGKEGKAIKRMLARGFTPTQILEVWMAKCKKAGVFKSMVYVNEDIEAGKLSHDKEDPDRFIKGKYGDAVRRSMDEHDSGLHQTIEEIQAQLAKEKSDHEEKQC